MPRETVELSLNPDSALTDQLSLYRRFSGNRKHTSDLISESQPGSPGRVVPGIYLVIVWVHVPGPGMGVCVTLPTLFEF